MSGVFAITLPLIGIIVHPHLSAALSWLLVLSVFAGIGMMLHGALWYTYENEDAS